MAGLRQLRSLHMAAEAGFLSTTWCQPRLREVWFQVAGGAGLQGQGCDLRKAEQGFRQQSSHWDWERQPRGLFS